MKSFMLHFVGGKKVGVEGETIHEAIRNSGLTQNGLRKDGYLSFAEVRELPLLDANEPIPACTI